MKINPRFAVFAALLSILVGAVWVVRGIVPPTAPAAQIRLVASPTASEMQEVSAAAPAQKSPAERVNAASAPQADNTVDAPVWDLCGVGRLPIPQGLSDMASGGWSQLPKHLGEEAQDNARERLLQAMGRGDARTRGAALLLNLGYAQRFARSDAELRAAEAAAAQTQQALLALAQSSGDPAVASWAVASCRGDLACKTTANAVWRQVEPDNATPWMVELDLASEDPTRVLGAMARSTRYYVYPGTVAGAALAAMPSDLPSYLQQRVLLDVMRMEDQQTQRHGVKGSGGPVRGPLVDLCVQTTDSMGQAVSSQSTPQGADCRAIAQLFADRSDALDSHTLGLRLGRAAGWPLAEVNDRLEQAKVLSNAGMSSLGAQPYACAAVDKTRAWVRDTASRGEMLALRSLSAEVIQPATKQPAQR